MRVQFFGILQKVEEDEEEDVDLPEEVTRAGKFAPQGLIDKDVGFRAAVTPKTTMRVPSLHRLHRTALVP